MTINQRIKELRKELGYNQIDFGNKIGLKNSAVSKMEQDGSTVTDQNIRMICDTFGIAERWLRTGEGEMRVDDRRAYIHKLAQQYQLGDAHAGLIEAFLNLSAAQRDNLLGIMRQMVAAADAAEQNGGAAKMPTAEDSSAVPATVKESSTVAPSHTSVANRFSAAARQDVPSTAQAINDELAAYKEELEAQQKGPSRSAGTGGTGESHV